MRRERANYMTIFHLNDNEMAAIFKPIICCMYITPSPYLTSGSR